MAMMMVARMMAVMMAVMMVVMMAVEKLDVQMTRKYVFP